MNQRNLKWALCFLLMVINISVRAQDTIHSTTEVLKGILTYSREYTEMKDYDGVAVYNVKPVKLPEPSAISSQHAGRNEALKLSVERRGGTAIPDVIFSADVDNKAFQPADNTVAVGNKGEIVTANNNNFTFYDSSFQFKKRVGLQNFFGIADKTDVGQQVFDPQVLFDPLRQRWLVVADYVEFSKSNGDYDLSANKIYVAVSKSDSLTGGWYVAAIPGIQTVDNALWASDFPTISFTATEMFIMASLSKLTGTISHQVAYELDFKEVYAGNVKRVLRHYFSDISGFTAAHNNFDNQNSRLYLVHTSHNAPLLGTRNLDIAWIESNIADTNNRISMLYHLDMAEPYFRKNSSPQRGSTKRLASAGCVIRSCFYDKGLIHAVFTTVVKGKTAIYYVRIRPDWVDPEFSKTWCRILSHPDYDLGYSSVCYAGARDKDSVDGVLIAANYTSKNDFPGYGIFYVGPDGSVSDYQVIHSGWGYYQWPANLDTPVRWGDYTGVAMQHNKRGRFVVTGQYGSEINQVTSHFAVLDHLSAHTANGNIPEGAKVFPNPATPGRPVSVQFQNQIPRNVSVSVSDLSGRVVLNSPSHFLKSGYCNVDITMANLSPGAYVIDIRDEATGLVLMQQQVVLGTN